MPESVLVFAACSASAWVGLRTLDFFWRPIGVRPLGGRTLSYSCDGPGATVSRIMAWGKVTEFLKGRRPGERHPAYPSLVASGSRIIVAFPSGRWLQWFPPLLAEVTTTYRPVGS
jgi:YD repeat-containing protein